MQIKSTDASWCLSTEGKCLHMVGCKKKKDTGMCVLVCVCASVCAAPDLQCCMVNRNTFLGRRNFPQQSPRSVIVAVMSCSCHSAFRSPSLIHVPAAHHLQLEQMFTPMRNRQTLPSAQFLTH